MKELNRQQDEGNKDTEQVTASSPSKAHLRTFRAQPSRKQFSGTALTSVSRCALLFLTARSVQAVLFSPMFSPSAT